MVTLTWFHTRTQRPMSRVLSMSQALVTMMMIRAVVPNHPMWIDGRAV